MDGTADGTRPIVKPENRAPRLKDLLKGMTPEAIHEALDWGDDKGREAMDD